MNSEIEKQHSFTPEELPIRLEIMNRMSSLHARIGDALGQWAEMTTADEGAKSARFVEALLRETTGALDEAYGRRLSGSLHPLEQEHWVPALEALRQNLRKAAESLSTMPGVQLERAVEQLRRSMSTFKKPG